MDNGTSTDIRGSQLMYPNYWMDEVPQDELE